MSWRPAWRYCSRGKPGRQASGQPAGTDGAAAGSGLGGRPAPTPATAPAPQAAPASVRPPSLAHRGGGAPAKPPQPGSRGTDWDAELAAAITHERQAEQSALAVSAGAATVQEENVTEEGWLPR